MATNTYQAALKTAKEELNALVVEQGELQERLQAIEPRLADLRQSIAALSKLAGEEFDEEEALGLTDMIRRVMQEAGRQITTQDVERMLESRGFNTKRYGNLQASIITVMKRLIPKRQVREEGTIGGKPAYRWIGPTPPPEVITVDVDGLGLSATPNARIHKK
jgi:hypothetical protein